MPQTDPVDPGDPTPPTTSPSTYTSSEPCPIDPSIEVIQVAAEEGLLANQRALEVTLSSAATVAALCSADGDRADVHLVESDSPATEHTLQFSGLLRNESYTCQVAPTCPFAVDAPVEQGFSTGAGPSLPTLQVEIDPDLGMTGAWTMLSFKDGACSAATGWIVIYDPEGRARWWYPLPSAGWIDIEALFHPSDQTVVWGGGGSIEGRPHVVHLWDGEAYIADLPNWQDHGFHHDGKRMEDGRFLTLEYRDNTSGPSGWEGFGIQIFDPVTQQVDLEIDSQRYVDEGWLRTAGEWWDQDPYHANWMDWVEHPSGTQLYISLCFDQSILSLDETGSVLWKLQNDGQWTVQDALGAPLSDDVLPQCQHGLEVLGPDRLLVYDNGQNRNESRALDLTVDADAKVVTVDWMWSEPGWQEDTLGDIDDLGNGRVLITEAHPDCWSPQNGLNSNIVEVDQATGEVASRLTFPNADHTTYRAERYDGCTLFASTTHCPDLAARAAALDSVLTP